MALKNKLAVVDEDSQIQLIQVRSITKATEQEKKELTNELLLGNYEVIHVAVPKNFRLGIVY